MFPLVQHALINVQPLGIPSTGGDTETTPEQDDLVDVARDSYLACEGEFDPAAEYWSTDGCHRRHSELGYLGVGEWMIRRHRSGFSGQWAGAVGTHERLDVANQQFIGDI